jgi:hypothetical protein
MRRWANRGMDARLRSIVCTAAASVFWLDGHTMGAAEPNGAAPEVQPQTSPQARTLKAVVLDPNGRPAPDVEVAIYGWYSSHTAAGADGSFEFVFPAKDQSWGQHTILVRDVTKGLAASMDSADLEKAGRIKLEPGMRLVGKVVDPNGRGIPLAQLSMVLRMSDVGYGIPEKVTAAEDGSFVIPAMARGCTYGVEARARGYGTASSQIEASEERAQVELADLTLAVADQSLAGVVVDQESKPVAGVRIDGYGQHQPFSETSTNKEGRFILRGLVRGAVSIYAFRMEESGILHGEAEAQTGDPNVQVVVIERDLKGKPVQAKDKSLAGKPLPPLTDLAKDLARVQTDGKPVLLCFVDIEQRPSRRCLSDLAKKADALAAKAVTVLVVQVTPVDPKQHEDWLRTNQVAFSVHVADAGFDAAKAKWGVQSLPWLVLTDKEHVVKAEGFAMGELDERLAGIQGAK